MIFMSERILCFLNGEVKKYLPNLRGILACKGLSPESFLTLTILELY